MLEGKTVNLRTIERRNACENSRTASHGMMHSFIMVSELHRSQGTTTEE